MNDLNIYQRMLAISEEIENIPKNGWNDFSRYKYVKANDVIESVRKLMVKHGVFSQLSFEQTDRIQEGKNFHTSLKCTARFFNVDKPEEVLDFSSSGTAADTLDKDAYKAITNITKYIYIVAFKVPVDMPDVEDSANLEKNNTKPKEASKSAPPPSSPGDYVINIGKKFKGMKIREVDSSDLFDFIAWLESNAKESGKPLLGNAKNLVDYGKQYLDSIGR